MAFENIPTNNFENKELGSGFSFEKMPKEAKDKYRAKVIKMAGVLGRENTTLKKYDKLGKVFEIMSQVAIIHKINPPKNFA